MIDRKPSLKIAARLTLFLASYLPLFLIMIFTQVYKYKSIIKFDTINKDIFYLYVKHFGAALLLLLISVVGIIGLLILLKNMDRRAKNNGTAIRIDDIENKNSESISYLFTYLIPFVFQDLSGLSDVFSVTVLLIVTFLIYSNSSMLLINPTISMRYSLYMVEYTEQGCTKKKKQWLYQGIGSLKKMTK